MWIEVRNSACRGEGGVSWVVGRGGEGKGGGTRTRMGRVERREVSW